MFFESLNLMMRWTIPLVLALGCGASQRDRDETTCEQVVPAGAQQAEPERGGGRWESVETLSLAYVRAADTIHRRERPSCPGCDEFDETALSAAQVLDILEATITEAFGAGIDIRPLLGAARSLAGALGRLSSSIDRGDAERHEPLAQSVRDAEGTSLETLGSTLRAAADLHGRSQDSRSLQIRCMTSQALLFTLWLDLESDLLSRMRELEVEVSRAQARASVAEASAVDEERYEEQLRFELEDLTDRYILARGLSADLRSMDADPEALLREATRASETSHEGWRNAVVALDQTQRECRGADQ